MYNFTIIGAGSLGACFAIEATKRAAASKIPLNFHIYDFDKVEDRNLYSQDFLPCHLGKYKAEVIAEICNQFSNITAVPVLDKFTLDTELPYSSTLLVDCVDNIWTRQQIWIKGKQTNNPSLHLGMSLNGFGKVNFCYKDYDSFPYPINELNIQIDEPKEEVKKPPCYMNSQRPLITQTSLAGVTSAFIFMGHDPGDLMTTEDYRVDFPGIIIDWETTNDHGKESKSSFQEYTLN